MVAERSDAGREGDGIRLTRMVIEALPPLDHEDKSIKATVEA